MKFDQLRSRCRPHLWYQLYWVVYLIWFFWLDLTVTAPKYILHSPLDDLIPFNEWFVIPYCSWFLLLAGVTAALWWCDTATYDKLCLTMFSGMTFCLIVYMILPNGLELRPTVETLGRDNPALRIMQLLWKADAAVNVCPSIHCQSSACMAMAFSHSKLLFPFVLALLRKTRCGDEGFQPQQAGRGQASAQGAGMGVGGADLPVHRVHQAALGH